jgi:hypothetical protein
MLGVARILGTQEHDMTTTAWRFSGTEGADEAVLKLKQLETAKLVEVQMSPLSAGRSMPRSPRYASM